MLRVAGSHEGLRARITVPVSISALLLAGCTRAAEDMGEAVKGASSTACSAAEVDHVRAAVQQEAACHAYLSSVFRQNLPIKKSECCLMHLCV